MSKNTLTMQGLVSSRNYLRLSLVLLVLYHFLCELLSLPSLCVIPANAARIRTVTAHCNSWQSLRQGRFFCVLFFPRSCRFTLSDCSLVSPHFSATAQSWHYSNVRVLQTPAAQDMQQVLSLTTIGFGALLLVGLYTHNTLLLQASTLIHIVGTLVVFGAMLVTVFTAPFGFEGNVIAANLPQLILAAFGILALHREGANVGALLRSHDASESDSLLNIAFYGATCYTLLVTGNLILRNHDWVATLPEAVRPHVSDAVPELLSKYLAAVMAVLAVSRTLLYRTATREERSAIAATLLFTSVVGTEVFGTGKVLPDSSFAMRTLIIFLLAMGIRRNQNTPGPSLSLTARNALFLVVLYGNFYHLQSGGRFYESFVRHWLGAQAPLFLAPVPRFFASVHHFLGAFVIGVSWVVFVLDKESATRAALLFWIVFESAWTLVFVIKAGTYGFSQFSSALIIVQNGAVVALCAKALIESLFQSGESLASWARSVFAWSYAPIKGGLYLQVIAFALVSIVLFGPTETFSENLFNLAALGSDVAVVCRRGLALTTALLAFKLYLVTRTADQALGRALTVLFLGFNAAIILIVPSLISVPAISSLLSNYRAFVVVDTAAPAVMLVGLAASLYLDFHRDNEEDHASPRRRRRKVE